MSALPLSDEILAAYADGSLAPAQALWVEAALKRDAEARRRLAERQVEREAEREAAPPAAVAPATVPPAPAALMSDAPLIGLPYAARRRPKGLSPTAWAAVVAVLIFALLAAVMLWIIQA